MLKEVSWRFLGTKKYALELDKEAIIDPLSFGIGQYLSTTNQTTILYSLYLVNITFSFSPKPLIGHYERLLLLLIFWII